MPAADRRIDVTSDEIASAVQRDSTHCMIAEAIKRSRPDWKSISVDLQTIRYTDRLGQRHICLTPPVAQRGLLWFDQADNRLAPFSFKLPHAAQVLPKRGGEGPRKRSKPTVKQTRAAAPIVQGGTPPPLGALANSGGNVTKGKIRRYGLQRMGV